MKPMYEFHLTDLDTVRNFFYETNIRNQFLPKSILVFQSHINTSKITCCYELCIVYYILSDNQADAAQSIQD